MNALVDSLAAYRANLIELSGKRQAAVALVLDRAELPAKVLFIERATHPADPWSGQIAFPGGGVERSDPDAYGAACRETIEEVELDLQLADYIGRLDDQQGRSRNQEVDLVISCFVFSLHGNLQTMTPNYEVADVFWEPLQTLTDSAKQFSHQTQYRDQPYPAIKLQGNRVLWGLTYRFVQNFLTIIN